MEQVNTETSKETKSKKDSKVADIGTGKASAEAQGVTFQKIIDQVPENTQYNVLRGMVSSIGCSVIGSASTIVGRLERQFAGEDLISIEKSEILHMMMEADMRMDLLRNVRGLINVRQDLSDQLLAVANDDALVNWHESIEYMTQPGGASRVDKTRLLDALRACGLDDEKMLEMMYEQTKIAESEDRIRNAEQIAMRRGAIEWLIENVFAGTEYINEMGQYVEDTNIAHRVEDLPAEVQNRLYDKLRQTLNKGLQRCAQRYALSDSRYSLNDIIDLNNTIKQAQVLEAYEPD